MNLVYHHVEKRGRAYGRVEDKRFIIRQSLRFVEAVFKQVVNGAHDVGDDRLRCIVNAAHLPYLRVVFFQEGLIEMHHRVFLAAVLAKVLQDRFHICLGQYLCQVINQPGDSVIKVRPGDVIK